MTDGSSRDEEREGPSREGDEERRGEERDRRSEDLQEAWRRNHPSEEEEERKGRSGKGGSR